MLDLKNIDTAFDYWKDCVSITEGWCVDEKAKDLIELCYKKNVRSFFEIGIYGGMSFCAIAIGVERNSQIRNSPYAMYFGGIDSWSNDAAACGNSKGDLQWWSSVNLQDIESKFYNVVESKLKPNIITETDTFNIIHGSTMSGEIREKIRENVEANTFYYDLVHIDGNHSEYAALGDCALTLDLIHKDSVVVLDDTGSFETYKGEEYLDVMLEKKFGIKKQFRESYAVYYGF